MIRDYSLQPNIEQPGHLSQQELAHLYRSASISVLPSYYETFGLSALEPMAYGVPVVATRAGGLVEVIEDGTTGLLVAPGDADALARAIIDLLSKPMRRAEMGRAGRKLVRERFGIEHNVERTLAVYKEVSARPAQIQSRQLTAA